MENLIISADASSDLTGELINQYNISIAPFEYYVNAYSYNTKTNKMTAKQFYDNMKNGADVKTSQINYQEAKGYIEKLLKTGKDVFHICFSSGLSGTYDNFERASKELSNQYSNKCIVIDSLCAAAGGALLAVLVAKKVMNEKIDLEELEKYANELKYRINHIFTVDDLKYLVKGGRVSKGSAMIANILHIKPILNVDNNGKLAVTNKIFSRKLAIKKIFDKMESNYDIQYKDILISHADSEKDAKTLKTMIEQKYDANITIVPLDFVIGCHSGPGTLALFYVGDKR
jgi:DegV family protein with EDD domain